MDPSHRGGKSSRLVAWSKHRLSRCRYGFACLRRDRMPLRASAWWLTTTLAAPSPQLTSPQSKERRGREKEGGRERNKERFGDVEKDHAGRARRGCSARRRSLSGSDFPVLGSLKVDTIITILIIAIIIGIGRGRGSSTSGAPPCPPCEAIPVPQEGNGRRLRHRGVRGGRARVGGSSQARKVCQDSRWDFESPHPSP